jgi:hypothetical protein
MGTKNKKRVEKKGLTDKQLIGKYNTGKAVDFDKAIKRMSKSPSQFSLLKQKK